MNQHPSNKHPLRAWLVKEQRIVQCAGIDFRLKIIHVPYPDNPELFAHYTYRNPQEAHLLHPTGIEVREECPKCYGEKIMTVAGIEEIYRCDRCLGTGYVPAMIYEADVTISNVSRAFDGGHIVSGLEIGIVRWKQERLGFARKCIDCEGNVHDDPHLDFDNEMPIDDSHIILCSAFNLCAKPDGVSDEQWACVVAEAKELRG